eukprot:gb/GFBE01073484.1/.p2 GENE.gb/GFBE01073484.1/~~gb/GFBE01073484.1/.p2  ORF type:complete len:118 (-),score=12.97 gb/GFBE01073484.1/:14-367(-)
MTEALPLAPPGAAACAAGAGLKPLSAEVETQTSGTDLLDSTNSTKSDGQGDQTTMAGKRSLLSAVANGRSLGCPNCLVRCSSSAQENQASSYGFAWHTALTKPWQLDRLSVVRGGRG